MNLLLKMAAPWIAVGICWCIFKNGWLAILVYHAQVLFWNRRSLRLLRRPADRRWLPAALPTIVAGPLLYVLLPHITHTNLSSWLAEYKLTGRPLLLMIPYFGIIHPVLEQMHWAPLREQTPFAHLFFAGYHMPVLASLVTAPWLIFCFFALTLASLVWQWLTRTSGSLMPAVLSHLCADLGIILAASYYFTVSGGN